MTTKHEICGLGDIPDNEAKGFIIESEAKQPEILIFRKDDRYYGYVNRCPHTAVNLDWIPNQFLDRNGKYLQCSTHGAKFRIKDGHCIMGSCKSDKLKAINIKMRDTRLILETD